MTWPYSRNSYAGSAAGPCEEQPAKDKSARFCRNIASRMPSKNTLKKVLALSVVAVTMAILPTPDGYLFSGRFGGLGAWNARSCVTRVANIELGTKVIPELDDRQNESAVGGKG